ncbi:MAG: hypothetical protein ACR2MF_00515 [Chthoniobacterales bacterium]
MEQKRERKKLWWAIAASVFVHLAVAYSLAAFGSAFTPAAAPLEEEKPTELTFVDLTTATPHVTTPPNPAFIETDPAKESKEKPEEQTFESNANSIAASTLPAAGDAPLPTQKGKDRPFMNLETHQYSLPTEGDTARPQPKEATTAVVPKPVATPKSKPSEPPKATPSVAPVATPEPEQFAMLTVTPPPPISTPGETDATPPPEVAASAAPTAPRSQPERPSSAYQSQKEQTRVTGRITNRGLASVNAVGTPLGRYQKSVSDAIGSRWYYYMNSKMDLVSVGTAHVEAEVDAKGHLQKLKVLSNNANEAFANICLQSFQEAHLPPIPPDLVATLPEGRMPVDIFFTTYANQ